MTIPELSDVPTLRQHLRLPAEGPDDDDLQRKLDAATQLICEYIADKHPADTDWIEEIEGWTDETAPKVIVLAVLEQAGEFFRVRGDDEKPLGERGYLSPGVENLLSRYKNRAFA